MQELINELTERRNKYKKDIKNMTDNLYNLNKNVDKLDTEIRDLKRRQFIDKFDLNINEINYGIINRGMIKI